MPCFINAFFLKKIVWFILTQDLSKLNRNPGKVVYISGHALESCLQPENCIEIKPWKLESDDTALLDLIPFLECKFSYEHIVLLFFTFLSATMDLKIKLKEMYPLNSEKSLLQLNSSKHFVQLLQVNQQILELC